MRNKLKLHESHDKIEKIISVVQEYQFHCIGIEGSGGAILPFVAEHTPKTIFGSTFLLFIPFTVAVLGLWHLSSVLRNKKDFIFAAFFILIVTCLFCTWILPSEYATCLSMSSNSLTNSFERLRTSYALLSSFNAVCVALNEHESISIRKHTWYTDPMWSRKKKSLKTQTRSVLSNSHLRKLFTYTICWIGATCRENCAKIRRWLSHRRRQHSKMTGLSFANE